jgi:hypothetical protein
MSFRHLDVSFHFIWIYPSECHSGIRMCNSVICRRIIHSGTGAHCHSGIRMCHSILSGYFLLISGYVIPASGCVIPFYLDISFRMSGIRMCNSVICRRIIHSGTGEHCYSGIRICHSVFKTYHSGTGPQCHPTYGCVIPFYRDMSF